MYSAEDLSAYPFFREVLKASSLPTIHDSLTGLIARPFMLRFVQSLIQDRKPFTLMIVDLDNFKNINDNYGHRAGDEMLAAVAEELRRVIGKDGIVGRYGGDEFLITYFGHTDYDGVHGFLDELYTGASKVFRKNMRVSDRSIFSTATVGCAIFPADADTFESLFALIDKTLYRGKSKGRNCFIIYVPAKHAHLEIPTLARRSLYDAFQSMAEGFDSGSTAVDKLQRAFAPVRDNLRMYGLFFIDADLRLFDEQAGAYLENVETPQPLLHNGLFTACGLDELERCCPALSRQLAERCFESVLILEVSRPGHPYGYLVLCPEIRTLHIWQEHECAAAFFLARMLAQQLEAQGGRF